MAKNIRIKVNKNFGKDLAKEIEKNFRQKGVKVKVDQKSIREIQKSVNKLEK